MFCLYRTLRVHVCRGCWSLCWSGHVSGWSTRQGGRFPRSRTVTGESAIQRYANCCSTHILSISHFRGYRDNLGAMIAVCSCARYYIDSLAQRLSFLWYHSLLVGSAIITGAPPIQRSRSPSPTCADSDTSWEWNWRTRDSAPTSPGKYLITRSIFNRISPKNFIPR